MRQITPTSQSRFRRCFPGSMLLRRKGLIAFLFISIAAITSLIAHVSSKRGSSPVQWVKGLKGSTVETCPNDVAWLNSLNIAFPVKYARRDIIVSPNSSRERKSVTRIEEDLFPEFQSIDLSEGSHVQLQHCKVPLNLEVPGSTLEGIDASHIIFGISTTLRRLEDTLPSLQRWLPNSGARLFVLVIESEQEGEVKAVAANPGKKKDLQKRMRDMGMDATLVDPPKLEDSFSEKYFSMVKVMYENRNSDTQWLSTIDDDTFFPSMSGLVKMLGKYDPEKPHYVGGLSEIWWAVSHYGMMGFGGAGVFLSLAMGGILHENYQACKETSHTSAGDIRIMECIQATTNVKLSNERDLHQIDVFKDLSGLLESGNQLLSLHHWKPGASTKDGEDLPTMHMVADVCQECFLQRWWFNGDLLLTNGYSVSVYPKGDLKKANLEYMEETWDPVTQVDFSNNHGTDHSLGPTRPALELNVQKIQYKLVASSPVDGGVRQAYLHPGVNGEMDSLLELFWVQGPNSEAQTGP